MNLNCPHCGKISFRTFCEHCGKPTESLLKYRVMYFIGLISISLVTYFCYIEFNRLLPEIETNIADVFALTFLPAVLIAGFSVLSIICQWINIEIQFYEYNKKIKERNNGYGTNKKTN